MRSRHPHLRHAGLAGLLSCCLPALAAAVTLTGVVKNEAGTGIGNVDIDFIDACTGANVFIVSDHTAADGTFSLVVPAGTYDVHFLPPFATSTVAAADLQSLVVTANASLGTVTLHPGRLVSGTVLTPALAPAANVDLKFVDAVADHRVFLTKTVTDAAGHWSVRVPPGSWDVDFRPAVGSAFADAERIGLVVGATDISGLTDVLKTGFAVTGNVRGQSNAKLANVDVDLYDDCTGRRVPTAHDNTDVNGNFSIVVPAGSYTLSLDPPACLDAEAYRQPGISIGGASNLGQFTLKAVVPVSGQILGPNGLPLADAKLKFYDVTVTPAVRIGTARDRTDANGNFSVSVPRGVYDVNVEAPVGVNALVLHLNNVDSGNSGTNIGAWQMSTGTPLSGHVQGPGAVPVLNCNLNIVDHFTRVQQRVAHDNTDANGNVTVYVNPGTYDIHFDPPACTGLAPWSQDSVVVGGALVLPTQSLVTGVHLQGLVTDPVPLAAANVDLDVYPAGGAVKLYTPSDNTSLTGNYDVLVPPGTYDVRYVPSSLTRLRPALRSNVTLNTPVTQPTVVLANGWLVSGTVVQQFTVLPVANVDLEFYTQSYLPPLWAPHHTTGTLGTFSTAVDAGTYMVRVVPPALSPFIPTVLMNVVVAGDVALGNVELRLASTGVGEGPSGALQFAAPAPNPARGSVRLSFSLPDGAGELTAWDVLGRQVATIWRGASAGPQTVTWSGRRDNGSPLPAGLYLVRLTDARGARLLRRVTLLP